MRQEIVDFMTPSFRDSNFGVKGINIYSSLLMGVDQTNWRPEVKVLQ